jgi:hypothetical protein
MFLLLVLALAGSVEALNIASAVALSVGAVADAIDVADAIAVTLLPLFLVLHVLFSYLQNYPILLMGSQLKFGRYLL